MFIDFIQDGLVKKKKKKKEFLSWLSRNESDYHENAGLIPCLAQWVKDLALL